ncbi:MAG: putative rane protein [Lachnospiraceae bacterium]|nr:putative rane protein [Lachnospiraceae bacterium]
MKIAFWGNAKGSCGVTSNLACISVASVMRYSFKAVLWENHTQQNNLEQALLCRQTNHYLSEMNHYQIHPVGMTHIMNQFAYSNHGFSASAQNITSEADYNENRIIKEASYEILNESLYYIPSSFKVNREIYDYDIYSNVNKILQSLDTFADIIYIDTSNRNSLSSKVILEEADLVVVNLTQNSSVIQHFFDNYSSIQSKCVFLISGYHKQSCLNINAISKLHSIKKTQITVIPYNLEYQEAVSQGTIVEFLSRNYTCKRRSPNYEFVNQVKKAVEMIMNHINYMEQQEAMR